MNKLKRALGLLWMLISPVIIIILIRGAVHYIGAGTKEFNKPLPWLIIICIFTPIAIGFMIFGWYSWKGEYDKLPE